MINILIITFISLGLFFFLGTSIGLLRLPDFYTRMHAAGKGDTFSTILILIGCALHAMSSGHFDSASILVGVKILLIIHFIFIGSPTATHAITDAGYELEIPHWEKKS